MSAGSDIGDRTRRRLTGFLRSLPPARARLLADAVENARRAGDTDLPHRLILEALQPAMEPDAASPDPVLRPAELFALPLKDLLVDSRPSKRQGRIARSSVATVWDWLSREQCPELGNGAVEPDRFHRDCARALRDAIADPAAHEALTVRLGGRDVLEDARDMAAILEIAKDALELQRRFPRPLANLHVAGFNRLVLIFDDFAERHPNRVAHFFFILSGRMDKPWNVLPLMAEMAGRVHSGRPDAADMDALRELLFAELEAAAEFFRRLNSTSFDAAVVAQALKRFTRMVNGLSTSAPLPADGPWARRMMNCRSLVAEKMEILMERVPRDILAALPVHKIGRFGRVRRRPDIGTSPDAVRAGQAMRMADLVEACRAYAADAAFKVAFSEAVADTREGLSEYSKALLEEIKRLEPETAEPAHAYLDLVIRLTARAVGPEEAGRLRRDATALGAQGLPDVAVS